jgi:flagellar protein FliL
MATTAAAPDEAPTDAAPLPAKSKKKMLLIVIAATLVLLLAAGGGAAFYVMKKKAAETSEAEGESESEPVADGEPVQKAKKKDDKKHGAVPVFLPLEMFTVNLADRESERYAQVGITLEVGDSKTSDHLKAYMPAIRNDILMVLAHKKAAQLQLREGKLELAREIKRAALKALHAGDNEAGEDDNDGEDDEVRAVHFSSFIIQ